MTTTQEYANFVDQIVADGMTSGIIRTAEGATAGEYSVNATDGMTELPLGQRMAFMSLQIIMVMMTLSFSSLMPMKYHRTTMLFLIMISHIVAQVPRRLLIKSQRP